MQPLDIYYILENNDEKYEISRLISEGGSSIVYEAVLKQATGLETYIIKELYPHNDGRFCLTRGEDNSLIVSDMNTFDEYKESFKREYQRSLNFKSNNHLIKPKCLIEENNTFYIVMKKENGETLTEYIKEYIREMEHELLMEDALNITLSIAENLRYLHEEEKLYHLDLSINNVFVMPTRSRKIKTKLFDFGTSRKYEGSNYTVNSASPGFASPEQFSGSSLDVNFTTDVYGLFSILYNMLTSKLFNYQDVNSDFYIYIEKYDENMEYIDTDTGTLDYLKTNRKTVEKLNSLFKVAFNPDSAYRKEQLDSIQAVMRTLRMLLKSCNYDTDSREEISKNTKTLNYDHMLRRVLTQDRALSIPLGEVDEETFWFDLANNDSLLIVGDSKDNIREGLQSCVVSLSENKHPLEPKFLFMDYKSSYFKDFEKYRRLLAPVGNSTYLVTNIFDYVQRELAMRKKVVKDMGFEHFNQVNNKYGQVVLPPIVIVLSDLLNLLGLFGSKLTDWVTMLIENAKQYGIFLLVGISETTGEMDLMIDSFPNRLYYRVESRKTLRKMPDCLEASKMKGPGETVVKLGNASDMKRIKTYKLTHEELKEYLDEQSGKEIFPNLIPLRLGEYLIDSEYDQVLKYAVEEGRVNSGHLKRRFRLSGNHADRIIKQMETFGHLNVREDYGFQRVLIDYHEMEMFFNKINDLNFKAEYKRKYIHHERFTANFNFNPAFVNNKPTDERLIPYDELLDYGHDLEGYYVYRRSSETGKILRVDFQPPLR